MDFQKLTKGKGKKHYVMKQPAITLVSPVAQQITAAKALLNPKTAVKRKASASWLLQTKKRK
jgi:hypothetical protein